VNHIELWYKDSFELELGITTPEWITKLPLDKGTIRTISEGAQVIIYKIGVLEKMILSCKKDI